MLEIIGNHCSAVLAGDFPLLLALFLGGLAGSVSHCVVMCSPFVLGQIAGHTPQTVLGRVLLPYHLGRATTYAALGAAAGFTLRYITDTPWFTLLSKFLLTAAACFFLAALLQRLKLPFLSWQRLLPACAFKQIERLMALPHWPQRYGLGLLLGFIPCGLVFAALMAVAATGSPLTGAVGMLLFALGTMPALMLLSFGGTALTQRVGKAKAYAGTVLLGINSLILFYMAGA